MQIKKSWSIFPTDKNGLNQGTYKYSYTYQGKKYNGQSNYTELRRPVDTIQFKKYKNNLISIVEEFTQKDDTLIKFHFCSDDSAQEHGVFGWGFVVKKNSGTYNVLSSYIDSHGKRKKFKDDTMLKIYCHPDVFYKNPNKYFSILSKNKHPYYSDGLNLELCLKDITISLNNIGDAMIYLEKDNIQDWLDKGIINESKLIVELGLKGYSKNINKHLIHFKKRLGTAFIESSD